MKVSKNILFAAVFLLLIFICVFIILKKDGSIAGIYCDGVLYETVDLSKVKEPYTIDVNGKNTVLVEPGKISMQTAECPDKLCVNQGKIMAGEYPIVCLPNKVIIKIEK